MNSGDTAWVLASAALVLFMTPGLAFFYGGMVRAKNVLGMLMQNFFCMGVISVLWMLVVFSLAFGDDHGGLIGGFNFAGLSGLTHAGATLPGYTGALALTVPPIAFVAYQMMFAVITPALITGATADRLRFAGFAVFAGLWAVLVYAPVAHWVFSPNGWLAQRGALDFAGGTVVHINAGAAALAVVLVVGHRRGWPGEAMPPHSLPLTLLGAGILWFGWFGFNAGSALGANALAAQALINTHLAAAAAMLGWLVVERLKDHRATTLGAASGAVAGLVAITPCAGYVNAAAAVVVGLVAGVVCFLAISLKYRFRYDDALDVIGVHLVGGIVGSLLVGVFATRAVNANGRDGLLAGGGLQLLGEQALAVGVTMIFSFSVSFVLAKAIDATIGLRVTPDEEIEGLDTTQHAETGYNLRELGSMGRIA
ncbi:MAG: ammonium transporter, Amt family [Acidimicrobiaceae bacterium]|jgi:Amt family ammonium transporter|nr:ammonium transporter, Amt family [Acidimicrobiaceae bacterium]MDQ1367594.1 ammonium transporter, Amt family [Acidimicrobiaceae bacterium]